MAIGFYLKSQLRSFQHIIQYFVSFYWTDWVLQLGPATFNGTLYQYSVVSDPRQLQLFVLARNVTGFMIDYAEKVRMQLYYQGFNKFLNKPLVTYQGPDCKYIP